ncbi:MAG: nicotinamidase/pyrazinamidase, partial [Thermoleophilales bacterium]|nr:nicotinamidase/pyrazinamidase [Thermoleophilales bacterium]
MSEALLIIDFQNDFASPDGALSVRGGEDIAPRINQLAKTGGYEVVVATRVWHPPDHKSYKEQVGNWPVHTVQRTDGADHDPALDLEDVDLVLDKANNHE